MSLMNVAAVQWPQQTYPQRYHIILRCSYLKWSDEQNH